MNEVGTHAHLISCLGLNMQANLLVVLVEKLGPFIHQLDIFGRPFFIIVELLENF